MEREFPKIFVFFVPVMLLEIEKDQFVVKGLNYDNAIISSGSRGKWPFKFGKQRDSYLLPDTNKG